LDQNVAWQQINKEAGAKVNLVNNVSNADYRTKLSTTIAGGDLPDSMYIPAGTAIPQFPDFLDQKAADLTPYLSGDAIKAYPNLANIPTTAWKSVIYKNRIYGVPVTFPIVPGTVLWTHEEMLEAAKQPAPKSTADMKTLLTALKNPSAGVWGIGGQGGTSGTGGAYDLGMWIMYHYAPNNWKADASGKLTRSYETDQYKTAVGYARDLVAAGLYHPDSPSFNVVSIRTAFVGRKFVFNNSGWLAAATQYWEGGLQQTNPPSKLGITPPFGSDGGTGSFYLGPQLFGWSMLKKAPDARVKELLGLFNFLAAPFGSQEQLLLNYGIQGTDFNYDSSGNPVFTPKGKTDNNSLWGYIVAPPQVYYNANNPKAYADMMWNGAKAMIAVGVNDPTLGLYSDTNASKGPVIQQTFLQSVSEIIAGRRPLTDYDGLVNAWKSSGGDTIRTEFEQALSAAA